MTKTMKVALLIPSLVVVLAAAVFVGKKMGTGDGGKAKERLQLVWPSIMEMPEVDRAFIVGLAMTCRLQQRPAAASETIACLREAANDPDATLPKGFDQSRASTKLEDLLRARVESQ